MNLALLIRLFLAILCVGGLLYAYLNKQNMITELRLEIPAHTKQLLEITQKNTRLQFEIDRFEDPQHLMELARKPEFRHLTYPFEKDIITLDSP